MNRDLAVRVVGSLAVKALPAIYGAGFILFVLRVVPLEDFGRYSITIAFVNLVAGLSRGLWSASLVGSSALGRQEDVLGPVFWFGLATAAAGGLTGLILLPFLNVGHSMAAIAAVMLVVLVPRDIAFGLAQAQSRVVVAFLIEAGYFIGSLSVFMLLATRDKLDSAEMALTANVVAALLALIVGICFYPTLLKPRLSGKFREVYRNARWYGLLTVSDMALQQGDALIGGVFFSPAQLAPYLAARTLLKFYTLFSQAINFVAFPVAARLAAAGQFRLLKRRLRQSLGGLLVALLPVNIVIYLTADSIFPWLLGAKYLAAIPFFRALLVITFLEPIYSVVANAMVAAGRAPAIALPLVSGILINLALNLTLIPLWGIQGMVAVLLLTFAYLAGFMYWRIKTSFYTNEQPVLEAR
ncbi:polysaccharide biosynthesis C-terminal domain-containing protein [candidate division KSB1 bacterium]|nr:polysaccharide biosynthesis C-terminal domain-containing protein [candidate division KSB1 bacterium]